MTIQTTAARPNRNRSQTSFNAEMQRAWSNAEEKSIFFLLSLRSSANLCVSALILRLDSLELAAQFAQDDRRVIRRQAGAENMTGPKQCVMCFRWPQFYAPPPAGTSREMARARPASTQSWTSCFVSLATVHHEEYKAKYHKPDKPLRKRCKRQPLPKTQISMTKTAGQGQNEHHRIIENHRSHTQGGRLNPV